MPQLSQFVSIGRSLVAAGLIAAGLGVLGPVARLSAADAKPTAKRVTAAPPESAWLKVEDWQKTPIEALSPAELDRLIAAERQKLVTKGARLPEAAPQVSDEQFLRRVSLDVAGRLPTTDEHRQFLADSDPKKRALVIDRLLASEDYARHWGAYWTDVVSSRVSPIMKRNAPKFETWIVEQLQNNRNWSGIVRDILTAEAVLTDNAKRPADVPRFVPQPANGAAFFIATRYYEKTREEGAVDLAAETSRIFLGVQLQCAQCHNHPFDRWQREQFHQLAAYFARSGGRPRGMKDPGALGNFALTYYPDGEYEMPDAHDPKQTSLTHPLFLDGHGPGENLSDQDRRRALVDSLVDPRNYWFSAALINRVWGELMGQAFYYPVDDMGPERIAVMPAVLTRLSGAFRASDYDLKDLFRTILNSETYQRQFTVPVPADRHQYFTALVAAPLRAHVLARVLVEALSVEARPQLDSKSNEQLAKEIEAAFEADPSTRSEASLGQTLLVMNGSLIQGRLPATRTNLLARLLEKNSQDEDALAALYLATLGRQPREREIAAAKRHISSVGKRPQAFEDLLWAILNSAEFQTKR